MRTFQVVLRTSMKYSNHFMFVICTWNMARITHHMMFYLFMNFLSSNAAQIASFYVEKTHESPKSSCVEITNILGIERCAVKCLNTIAINANACAVLIWLEATLQILNGNHLFHVSIAQYYENKIIRQWPLSEHDHYFCRNLFFRF